MAVAPPNPTRPAATPRPGAPASSARTARARRGAASRQRLLDSAERLFAAHGFHGVALAEIAAACGLGNAGLLHHFPSKARLYRAVLENLAGALEGQLAAVLAAHQGPADQLRAMVRAQAAWTVARPDGARLILRELLDNVGRVDRAHVLPLKSFVAALCDLVDSAQASGGVRPGPAIVLLTQVLGALSYGLAARPTFARMRPDDPLLDDEPAWIEAVATAAAQALFKEA